MGVYSYKSEWGGGRKDKVFLKEILGRIRNFGAFSSIWRPKKAFFRKLFEKKSLISFIYPNFILSPPGHQEG